MYIISVIPIARGIDKEELTYYTAQKVVPGALVTIPLRKKEVPALVTSVEDARMEKAALRRGDFGLKKLIGVECDHFFSPAFLKAATTEAHYRASTTGAILNALLPTTLLKSTHDLFLNSQEFRNRSSTPRKSVAQKEAPHITALQINDTERITHYTQIIQEAFVQGASIFILVPTIYDVEYLSTTLKRDIGEGIFIFHSKLTTKKQLETWNTALTTKQPVFIIGTGQFLSLPRTDISTIIVEKENDSAYKALTRPYVDMRHFAETCAREIGASLILGDTLLRVETYARIQEKKIQALVPLTMDHAHTCTTDIIDMRPPKRSRDTSKPQEYKKHPFTTLSQQLKDVIHTLPQSGEHLFLYTTRRGRASTTVCNDCGETVLCAHCENPVTLYGPQKETAKESTFKKHTTYNTFVCHTCRATRSALETCIHCTSWNLVGLGIGIERVEEELTQAYPDTPLFIISSDTTRTHTQALTAYTAWRTTPGSMLLGTEQALRYLHAPVEHSAVISFDSLFFVPNFRISEKVMKLVTKLKHDTEKRLLIQTRSPEHPLVASLTVKDLTSWYTEELASRKQFAYPPHTTFIKLTLSSPRATLEKKVAPITKILKAYDPLTYPGYTASRPGYASTHILLTLQRDTWPDPKLLALLRSLPPYVSIDVDPESTL